MSQSTGSRSTDAIAYHETLAAGWSGRYAAGGMRRRANFFTSDVLPRLRASGDWLDVGCGSGVFSRKLGEAGARVLGLDGSPAMVEAARGASQGTNCRFEVARVEDVESLSERFDGAVCLSVIEYLERPEAAIAAIAAKLKPGGRLAFSAPNRRSTLRLAQRVVRRGASATGVNAFAYLDSSRHLWSRADLASLAQKAGLTVEATLGFDPVAPRALWPLISPSLWFVVAAKR